MYEPEIETLPWAEQRRLDDPVYRRQIEFLFANSRFYHDKLQAAGYDSPSGVGGIGDIHQLPLTEKDELRASRSDVDPIGTHLAVPMSDVSRIFSTSGTTGLPSYVPLTTDDLRSWLTISCRSYSASGVRPGDRIVTAYNAGPFVAGAALEAFHQLGLCHIPVGTGNTERLMAAVKVLRAQVLALTPSYTLHLAEWARDRGMDLRNSGVERILVAGEPGGGEPAMRTLLQEAWGAKVTEALGIGDISVSLWGECEEQCGMHFSGRGFVYFEMIDPQSGEPLPVVDGACGEIVLTHLRQRAAPLLRFRTRDHAIVWTERCACGRTAPRMRCIGRTDDMLILRGVNVFPSAIREVVDCYIPQVSGVMSVRPQSKRVKQEPPLKVLVELAGEGPPQSGLAERIERDIRAKLVVATKIEFVPAGSLPRSDYKSKLIDFCEATEDLIEHD